VLRSPFVVGPENSIRPAGFRRSRLATIDVLLPVQNALPFLGEAIDSIRAQTFYDWRMLILDHGSKDGSTALAQKYAELDKRIIFFSFPHADGLAELLNLGLERCDCRYVLRQDADDISVPGRMAKTSDLFFEHPDFLLIGGDALMIDGAGRQVGYLGVPSSPAAIRAACFFYNPMLHPTVAINFSALKQLGAVYGRDFMQAVPSENSLRVTRLAEDYFLFGQLALLGSCANISIPLVKYRRHGASIGISNSSSQIELALQVSRFLARSFTTKTELSQFDPAPFCNHAEYVFDLGLEDYSIQYEQMAAALRRGLGQSGELERELAFRWILAARKLPQMAARYFRFRSKYVATPSEGRTVRNWLLRRVRKGKYVYRAKRESAS
jgi:glycosyltransferase involved in cell wall biosynthesis